MRSKANPAWFKFAMDDLHVIRSRMSVVRDSLVKAKEWHAPDFYSNEKLLKLANKDQEYKVTLLNLDNEIEQHTKKLEHNNERYQKTLLEFSQVTAALELKRHALINQLIDWRNNNDLLFQKIELEFRSIKKQIGRDKKKSTDIAVINAYFPFLRQFGDKVKLIENASGYIENFVPLAPRHVMQSDRELRVKNPLELNSFAISTQSTAIIQQAAQFVVESAADKKQYELFIAKTPSWLKCVNTKICGDLDVSAKALTKAYDRAADDLGQRSSAVYGHILCEQDGIADEIKRATQALEKASQAFDAVNVTNDFNSIQSLNVRRDIVTKFDEVEKSYIAAKNLIDKVPDFSYQLMMKYKDAGDEFGVYRAQSVANFKVKTNKSLRDLKIFTEKSNVKITQASNKVEEIRLTVAKEDLLQLLQKAVEGNLDFWHDQVSWMGSRSAVRKKTVPTGIAQMAEDLRLASAGKKSIDSVLQQLKNTATLRKQAGTGFFARRTLSTTDVFYDILHKLDLSYFTNHGYNQIKMALDNIKDASGNRLMCYEESLPTDKIALAM
jgi:hypothetical protein